MTSCRNNTVSLQGGRDEKYPIADDAVVVTHQSRRKRKKQDEADQESPTTAVANTRAKSEYAAAPEDGEEAAPTPRMDNEKIAWIVTKCLWSDESKDVAKALHSLYKLLINEELKENRSTALLLGAPLVIVKAMKRHANNPEIQADGCYTLGAIAINHEIQRVPQAILETGALKACLLAMKRHHLDPLVQAAGCNMIGNLWFSPVVRKSVVDGGGLKAVIYAMAMNKLDTSVQDQGCYALYSLLRLESTWAKVAVDANGIEAIINAMENHWDHEHIQLEGCLFFSALAQNHEQDFRIRIIEAKGLVSLAEARRMHKDDYNVSREAEKAIKAILS